MASRSCVSGCGRFLTSSDGHDRCPSCLGFRHAEAALVEESCSHCGNYRHYRRPPSPERSRLDDWFLGAQAERRQLPPVPFFPEVHEEVTRSWKAPFSARNRPCLSSGRSSPRASIQACCCFNRRLCHGLGGHVQRARSRGALDRAPAAVAYQLPRVAGSMACSAPLQNAATREAYTGPLGQHCDRCAHQPPGRSTLPSHVATRPPSPPLESEASEVA